MHESATQDNARWNRSGPRMYHDKNHGKGTLRLGKTGDMESAAEGRTTQMAAPTTATVAAPTAMEATYAATTIPTPEAVKQCISDVPGYSAPAATVPATAGNVHAAETAATTWISTTVEYRSMTGRSGRYKGRKFNY